MYIYIIKCTQNGNFCIILCFCKREFIYEKEEKYDFHNVWGEGYTTVGDPLCLTCEEGRHCPRCGIHNPGHTFCSPAIKIK